MAKTRSNRCPLLNKIHSHTVLIICHNCANIIGKVHDKVITIEAFYLGFHRVKNGRTIENHNSLIVEQLCWTTNTMHSTHADLWALHFTHGETWKQQTGKSTWHFTLSKNVAHVAAHSFHASAYNITRHNQCGDEYGVVCWKLVRNDDFTVITDYWKNTINIVKLHWSAFNTQSIHERIIFLMQ